MTLIKLLLLLPLALWSGRTVKSIFRAGVDMWTDASSTLERAGWVPSLEMGGRLEEEHRFFVQLIFREPQFFL
jgi:hypothetical protein